MINFKEFLAEARHKIPGRIRIVKARVRSISGKAYIQRRKKVSNIKGYTVRNNKLIRINPLERMHRRKAQRLTGRMKRKAENKQIETKRIRSFRRRKALGIKNV